MGEELSERWQQVADFIQLRNSLDLGALSHLLARLARQPDPQPPLAFQATTFLEAVAVRCKTQPQVKGQSLALLALDCLLFSLYGWAQGGQGFRGASSSFYGWMSSSQMSEIGEPHRDTSRVVNLIQEVASSEPFFKRLRLALERNLHREHNQRYGENLVETLDYVLGRQKRNRQVFLKLRGKHLGSLLPAKPRPTIDFSRHNRILFGSKLNQILALLADGPDQLLLALIRIYWAGKDNCERRQLQGCQYTGFQMLLNLQAYYIESFQERSELFQESRHPLFRLIRCQLLQFHLPFFRQFHRLAARLAHPTDTSDPYAFYRAKQQQLEGQLCDLMGGMPMQLAQLLHDLHKLVEGHYRGEGQPAVTSIKKLLFYSFLLSPALVEDLLPRHDPASCSNTYNHCLLLFFPSSSRKFTHLPAPQQTLIARLVDCCSSRLDARIRQPEVTQLQQEESLDFPLPDPLLNHDYELVGEAIDKIEFTPKDMKNFAMRREAQAPESPLFKHFRSQQPPPAQTLPEQTDFATWMSVGGSRQYHRDSPSSRPPRAAERLAKLSTLARSKRDELQRQGREVWSYLKE